MRFKMAAVKCSLVQYFLDEDLQKRKALSATAWWSLAGELYTLPGPSCSASSSSSRK
jgi:hypothetical protein